MEGLSTEAFKARFERRPKRRYYDRVVGDEISRRRAEQRLGRQSFEEKAESNRRANPELAASRPARGRKSTRVENPDGQKIKFSDLLKRQQAGYSVDVGRLFGPFFARSAMSAAAHAKNTCERLASRGPAYVSSQIMYMFGDGTPIVAFTIRTNFAEFMPYFEKQLYELLDRAEESYSPKNPNIKILFNFSTGDLVKRDWDKTDAGKKWLEKKEQKIKAKNKKRAALTRKRQALQKREAELLEKLSERKKAGKSTKQVMRSLKANQKKLDSYFKESAKKPEGYL